ncbi:kelch repeat protein [Gigaspora margarita]|uniref:Kelch repeat protein n=1 Tax=Gigaspora margarita TaxID=4874 RepID=A0A8H3XFX8_GIGMA|nr:kelch repeat protein [Gigaspora margarita]
MNLFQNILALSYFVRCTFNHLSKYSYRSGSTSISIGPRLYFFGRQTASSDSEISSSIYVFNSKFHDGQHQVSIIPILALRTVLILQAVIDNSGKIFIFGGADFYGNSTAVCYNDMNILNITTMTWTTLPQLLNYDISPAYAAVLLQNGRIVYFVENSIIGGALTKSESGMTFSSSTIESHSGNSAVLNREYSTHYNYLYIFGVQNYAWVTSTASKTIFIDTQSSNDKLYIAIGVGVGGIILAVIIFTD